MEYQVFLNAVKFAYIPSLSCIKTKSEDLSPIVN